MQSRPTLLQRRLTEHPKRVQGYVGDISIIFPCSSAVGITKQYGIYVLLG